jgi:UDP-3-O-[3-hydroxymyristoyl] glucosamine N-acyltransferase
MMTPKFTLAELAKKLNGTLSGPSDMFITGVSDLSQATVGEISFISDKKYLSQLKETKASAIVTSPDISVDKPAIIVSKPELAFAELLELFAPEIPAPPKGIDPSANVEGILEAGVCVGTNAFIGKGTTVGENTIIFPNVYIGPDVKIGRDCLVWPGVVIRERVEIGNRVIIHPNAVIGSDGFGYNFIEGKHKKITHLGTVIIEDDVEIGSCACIDRAKAGATKILTGTKIDNLVQIGHNVKVGPHAILVAQVGVAGSTRIGDYAVLGGKVGVRDHITIGNRVQVAACSCVSKDIPEGLVIRGIPALDNRDFLRQHAALRRLPELAIKVSELTKRIHELEQTINDIQRSKP